MAMRLAAALVSLTLLAQLVPLASAARPAFAQTSGRAERSFQELGYGDQTARTTFGALSYFFRVPRGSAPLPGSRLVLAYSHSPLLLADRSTMTVSVNGQSVSSVFLTAESRRGAQLTVPLPTERFTGEGFFVQVQLAMRLTRDECEENQNPALWATIHGSSVLTLPVGPATGSLRLQDAGGPFAPARDEPVTLVVPDALQPEELEAAGITAYQIGRWAGEAGADPEIVVAAGPVAAARLVRVGTGATLGPAAALDQLTWTGEVFGTPAGTVPPDRGLIATGFGAAGDPELLVTGATPAAVLDAARALASDERRALLGGSHTVVTREPVATPRAAPWHAGAASFAQLGAARREVAGPGLHTVDLPFARPPGWQLQPGSALELHLEVSPGLRSQTSWVAATVDGFGIGTRRLDAAEGGLQKLRFDLPHDLLSSTLAGGPIRQLTLQLRIFLDVPQVGCVSASPGTAWAAVLPTSAWYLPHAAPFSLDLGRFPFPLAGADDARLTVVLPERPSREELSAGVRLIAGVGRWAGAHDGKPPRLITAERFGAADHQTHLILIGGPDRNAASAVAARTAGALFQPVPPAAQRLTANERTGSLRLGRSPFGRERALLAILGDGGGIAAAVDALTQNARLAQLRGQAVAVVDSLPPQTVTPASPLPAVPSTLAPRIEVPVTNRLPLWQVGSAVLLGVFLTLIAVVAWARLRPRATR